MRRIIKAPLKECVKYYTKFCSGFVDLTIQEKSMLECLIERDLELSKKINDESIKESLFLEPKFKKDLQLIFKTRQNVQRLINKLRDKKVVLETDSGFRLDSDLTFKPEIHVEFKPDEESN